MILTSTEPNIFRMLFSIKSLLYLLVGQKTCALHEILTRLVITENAFSQLEKTMLHKIRVIGTVGGPPLPVHKPNPHKVGTVLVIFLVSRRFPVIALTNPACSQPWTLLLYYWFFLSKIDSENCISYLPIFPFHWNTSISFYVSIGCKGVNKAAINKVKEK